MFDEPHKYKFEAQLKINQDLETANARLREAVERLQNQVLTVGDKIQRSDSYGIYTQLNKIEQEINRLSKAV